MSNDLQAGSQLSHAARIIPPKFRFPRASGCPQTRHNRCSPPGHYFRLDTYFALKMGVRGLPGHSVDGSPKRGSPPGTFRAKSRSKDVLETASHWSKPPASRSDETRIEEHVPTSA